jgi:hypothetical protein
MLGSPTPGIEHDVGSRDGSPERTRFACIGEVPVSNLYQEEHRERKGDINSMTKSFKKGKNKKKA